MFKITNNNYVAVIDIGSNAVRLMVYDALDRVPIKLYAERNICGLGKGLQETNRLNPDGVIKAFDSIARFSGLINNMKIKNVQAVGTASLRDAEDGKDFIKRAKQEYGIDIKVIEGEEEARLSALGVLANGIGQNGIIGDFGGGSLELIAVKNGQIQEQVTAPIGSLRLLSFKDNVDRTKFIENYIKSIDFLSKYKGYNLYVLGGAWRMIGRTHLYNKNYPVKTMDHYKIKYDEIMKFTSGLMNSEPSELTKLKAVSKRRSEDLPVASLAMNIVLKQMKPDNVVFSATGLREGLLYDLLPNKNKQENPIISLCSKIASGTSRFVSEEDMLELNDWMNCINDQCDNFLTLKKASCLLSDFSWFEHETVQAKHAFERILLMPFYGASHKFRIQLALSVYFRYQKKIVTDSDMNEYLKILTEQEIKQSQILGLTLALAYTLTGGALTLLKDTELYLDKAKSIKLSLSGRGKNLNGIIVKNIINDLNSIVL